MSIKRTIIVTAAIMASVAMVAPAFAGAVTVVDLQAQINSLLAQLQTLQGQPTDTGGIPSACIGITFTRNLAVGATGSDVKCLQALLNTSASTQVATTGAGSPGNETTYFGQLTLTAVKKYQTAHGWTPANQVGPMTRAALNATLGTGIVTTLPQGCTSTSGYSQTTGASCATGVVTPIVTLPQGCTSTSGYSPTTGASCATGVVAVIPTGSGLEVRLASDNPASAIVVAGQGLAPLAKFTFVNGDNAAVKVTNLKINRIGVSADADLANVYLLQGAIRLTDTASVSSGLITFNDSNGIFTVPAGGSVTITVASDICNTTNCTTIVGQTIGVNITSSANVTTNASSVKGTFPVSGNLFTVSNATLATVVFNATSTPSENTALNPQNDYTIWQTNTVVSTRAVTVTRLAFRLIGSIYAADLQNFRLYIDGVQKGSAVANTDGNGYVTFDLSSAPVSLQTGTRVIKVLANIVNGSSRTFNTSIRVAADANFVDSQYGVNIAPTTSGTSGSFTLADVTTGTQTIASGTVTFIKATDSPAGNIVNGSSNAVLAKYTLTAAGEAVKITDLYVRALFTNTDNTSDNYTGTSTAAAATEFTLRNGALYANGAQVGSTTDLSPVSGGTHFSLGSALVVTPGTPVTLEVRADIYDNMGTVNDIDATDTLVSRIETTASNAQRMTSLGTTTIPGTDVDGNTLTVAAGSLSLSKYGAYTNKTIVPPVTAYKLGHFTLTSSTTEATNLNTIYVNMMTNNTVISNLYVKYGTSSAMNQTTSIVDPSETSLANSWSINYLLAAGATIDVEVYGDVSSLATTSTYADMRIDGTTASSATAVSSGTITSYSGQTITFGTGSITGTQDSATPNDQIVAGGQAVIAGVFKFTAKNEAYTINELKFGIGDTNGSGAVAGTANAANAVTSVTLNGTGLATAPTAPVQYISSQYVAYFTGLNIALPANTAKSLTVVLNISSGISADTNTTNIDVEPYLSYIKVSDSQGVQTSDTNGAGSILGTQYVNRTYVYKSIPAINYVGADTHASTGANVELYKFTVGAPNVAVAVKQVKFVVTMTDTNGTGNNLTNFTFFRGTTNITGSVTITSATGTNLESTTSIGTGTVVVTFATEENIAAGATNTYKLMANANQFTATSAAGVDAIATYIPYDAAVATETSSYGGSYVNDNDDDGVFGLAATATGADGETYNFIWSDLSAASPTIHSYTDAEGSYDWYDGYLVTTANTTSQNVVAQ